MGVHDMHVGTILYFGAALAIGITFIVLGTMLNTQISGNCNNTVKHSIMGVIGLGVTLTIISILMFIIDRYCACTSAIGLFTLGFDLTNIGFFAILTMIISGIAITLGGIIDANLDEDCGKNVNKSLAKYIWIGGLISLVLSLVIVIINRLRSSDSLNDSKRELQSIRDAKEKTAKEIEKANEALKKAQEQLKIKREKSKKTNEPSTTAEDNDTDEAEDEELGLNKPVTNKSNWLWPRIFGGNQGNPVKKDIEVQMKPSQKRSGM